jgi:hypothetical protein
LFPGADEVAEAADHAFGFDGPAAFGATVVTLLPELIFTLPGHGEIFEFVVDRWSWHSDAIGAEVSKADEFAKMIPAPKHGDRRAALHSARCRIISYTSAIR